MTGERFGLGWELKIVDDGADELRQALDPDTGEHAEITVEDDVLTVEGEGPAGETLHTLDDVLACISAAEQGRDAVE